MTKFNVDEDTSLFEPLEIKLEGKTYIIDRITNKMMDDIGVIDKEDTNILAKQVSIFLGGDPEDYQNIDIRKLSAVLKFITASYTPSEEDKSKKA